MWFPRLKSDAYFTLGLVFAGLGALAFFLSSSFALLFSPDAMARRRNFRLRQKINRLSNHYIICGTGELVDKTIGYVLHGAEIRRAQLQDASYRPIESLLRRILGHPKSGRFAALHRVVGPIIPSVSQ